MSDFDLVVVGGGAAGFYGAIQSAEMNPRFRILILEKSNKLLAKVRVSGGGRCNVTHHCFNPIQLSHHYPRGEKFLRPLFKQYNAKDTVAWFSSKGVSLKIEADGRMFPVTDNSETIIDCFMREAARHKIKITTNAPVTEIRRERSVFKILVDGDKIYTAEKILIATGGSPKPDSYEWIKNLGHTIIPPIPSLFTFNDSEKKFTDLMGIAVPNAEIRISSTGFAQQGPLLITHWGLSGPAVIKISAWAAEQLHAVHYKFTALVSWIGPFKEAALYDFLIAQKATKGKQKIYSHSLFDLPQRLWVRLCELSAIDEGKIWAEASQKSLNKLVQNIIRCPFHINGKTTFKEEFVTCGGVDLNDIDPETMESKKVRGLFFAGEVLNEDGETGGFNFQSAWTTAFAAAKKMTAV